MPLSSVVGAQSIIRPGVCTSSTRPASPYDGQVIYETDTDKSLVYNGTGWVFLATSRANAGGLDLVKTQTIGSAVSTVTVSDAFSSIYDNYQIIVSGGGGSTAGRLTIALGATATGYYYGVTGWNYSNSQAAIGATNATAFDYAGYFNTDGINMNLSMIAPNLAKHTSTNGQYSENKTNGAGFSFAGYLANTTAYTAFTISAIGGTLTGGTIRVYGYVNS